jgi:DNA-binding phage protein
MKNAAVAIDLHDPDANWREVLQDEVRAFMRDGGRVGQLASAVNMSPTTVSRLAYGDTRFPRMHTVIMLLHHFGYRLTVQKAAPSNAVRRARLRAV